GINPEKDSHASGPCEFLWLIDHADYVITESFHGTVFAVNFSKKFVSLDPGLHTFSRFSNILEALGLMERVYTFDGKFSDNDIDYEAVHKKLNAMREKSMQYLRECLK
ncbi:MAG: polysaccharide pyruvyl transferase family protein, partial [Synergistaceae bacterium]|nr:polysaccharide pyruvyl transferase family protein [Synergistaceae bacterium]